MSRFERDHNFGRNSRLGLVASIVTIAATHFGQVDNPNIEANPVQHNQYSTRHLTELPQQTELPKLIYNHERDKINILATDLSRFGDDLDTEARIILTAGIIGFLFSQSAITKKTMENALRYNKRTAWSGLTLETVVGLYIIAKIWT